MNTAIAPALLAISLMFGACGETTTPPVDPADTTSPVKSTDTSDNQGYATH